MRRAVLAVLPPVLGLLLLVHAPAPALCADKEKPGLSVLFLFTFECPHCVTAFPLMEGLSARYPVQGIAYRTDADALPGKLASSGITFPVTVGDAAAKERYGVRQVPTAVLVSGGGRAREVLSGGRAVHSVERALETLAGGGRGIREILVKPESYVGKTITVAGRLAGSGGWFAGGPTRVVTNGTERIRVIPRLAGNTHEGERPKEGDRGPDDALDRHLDRLVRVTGTVRKGAGGIVIEARDVSPLQEERPPAAAARTR